MKEEDKYELIDQYLSGTLPDGHGFYVQLAQDPALADEVELQKFVRKAVLENRLKEVSKEIETFRTPTGSRIQKKYIAGGILLFLAIMTAMVLILGKKEEHFSEKNKVQADKSTKEPPQQIQAKPESVVSQHSPKSPGYNAPSGKAAPQTDEKVMVAPTAPQKLQTLDSKEAASVKIPDVPLPAAEPTAVVPAEKPTLISACDTTHFTAEIQRTSPCTKTSSGMLQVIRVSGGSGPYQYSIDGGKNFVNGKVFDQLSQGSYQVVVKDQHNCSGVVGKDILLTEKFCPEVNSFVFDPLRETWEVPFDKTKGGKITIHDKSGRIVYTKVFAAQEQLNWDGTSENGETLRPGYYIYMIEHTDGSVRQGSITISY